MINPSLYEQSIFYINALSNNIFIQIIHFLSHYSIAMTLLRNTLTSLASFCITSSVQSRTYPLRICQNCNIDTFTSLLLFSSCIDLLLYAHLSRLFRQLHHTSCIIRTGEIHYTSATDVQLQFSNKDSHCTSHKALRHRNHS